VIPKKEIDYIFDIEDPMLGRMMAFAKRVARAQEAVIPCKRVGLAVMGLEVPHAHIHLIPIQKESDMYFGGCNKFRRYHHPVSSRNRSL
jgi:histidine triad (HIT) family protein